MAWLFSKKKKAETLFQQAGQFIHHDEWAKALPLLKDAAKLNPQSAVILQSLGATLAKLPPQHASDEKLTHHLLEVTTTLESAMTLAEDQGGLTDQNYAKSCLICASFHRMKKDHEEAIRFCRWGLKHSPDDTELQTGLALSLFDSGHIDEASNLVDSILKSDSHSDAARRLWKMIRQQRGEGLTVDLPEEKRKQIYSDYRGALDTHFLLGSNLVDEVKEASRGGNITEIGRAIARSSSSAEESAREIVINRYGLDEFQLDLIIQEGKREVWPVNTVWNRERETPTSAAFRDSLRCAYCNKRNVAAFWPQNGDRVPFYFQSEERTKEQPEEFRLRIECPFCQKIWYVVWDQDPDPFAQQFIHHVERMCDQFGFDATRARAFYCLITDEILGKHLKFLNKSLKDSFQNQEKMEQSFETQDYFNIFWLIPQVDPVEARRFLPGGYLSQTERYLQQWNRDTQHLAHWIYCFTDQSSMVHLTFMPRNPDIRTLPLLVAHDLLSPEEKTQIGL